MSAHSLESSYWQKPEGHDKKQGWHLTLSSGENADRASWLTKWGEKGKLQQVRHNACWSRSFCDLPIHVLWLMSPPPQNQAVKWLFIEPDYFTCYDLIILMHFWLSILLLPADEVPEMLIVGRGYFAVQGRNKCDYFWHLTLAIQFSSWIDIAV